jgi:two-component system chemotaxis sensor kinase CheA
VRERAARAEKRRLEEVIEVRTRELHDANGNMRLVLDNVDQGLALVDLKGELKAEPSAAFASWFGQPAPGRHFASHIAAGSPGDQAKLRLGYEQVSDGFLPAAVALDQLPKELVIGDNHYALRFKPVIHGTTLEGTLLMVSDVTAQVAARRADAIQREQIDTFELVTRDRFGYLEFFSEARTLIESISENRFANRDEQIRAVHTLKGNAALFRAKSLSDVAHRLEQGLLEHDAEVVQDELGNLREAWERYSERTLRILGENAGEQVHFSRMQLKDLIVATSAVGRGERPLADIRRMLQGLRGVPVRDRLARIGEQIKGLSVRFGKGVPEVVIDADDFRLSPQRYGTFWSSIAHMVRNVVDHGFEKPEERRAAGKKESNRVVLGAKLKEGSFCIEIADDGRGIDWTRLAQRAAQAGLPHASRADLVDALYHPGISTAETLTLTSGRGVGMSAVAEACRALGGRIDVQSEPGQGTRFSLILPLLPGDVGDERDSVSPPRA